MIGTKQIIIGAEDFIKGMSSGPDISDGGFSNESDGVNLIANPGVLYAPADGVNSDPDVRLTGNIIATSPDMNLTGATNRLMVADNGSYYTYDGTKIPAAALQTDSSNTYAAGFTDIITYQGLAYVTTKEKLIEWTSPSTFNNSFATFTTSNVPHPAIVYEGYAYYADKNLLKQQTSAGGSLSTVLTLINTNEVIMALGIEPGTGLMLISTTSVIDTSGTLTAVNKIYQYDGNSAKVIRPGVYVDDTVFGFHSVGGIVYVGYGKKLGYWNGSGITFLRNLRNVTNVQAELPYKHHFAHIGNTLYVLDGLQILAYGEILPGQKKFYYAFKNKLNSNKPTAIADGGNNKLVFGFATTKFYSFDTMSVATIGQFNFFSNKYEFPRPVYLRGVYIEYSDAVPNNNNNRVLLYKTQAQENGFLQLDVENGTSLKNASGASVYFIDNIIGFGDNKVRSLQLNYGASSDNFGVKRIIVYWDPAE